MDGIPLGFDVDSISANCTANDICHRLHVASRGKPPLEKPAMAPVLGMLRIEKWITL